LRRGLGPVSFSPWPTEGGSSPRGEGYRNLFWGPGREHSPRTSHSGDGPSSFIDRHGEKKIPFKIQRQHFEEKLKDLRQYGYFFEYRTEKEFWRRRLGNLEPPVKAVFLVGSEAYEYLAVEIKVVSKNEVPEKYRGAIESDTAFAIRCVEQTQSNNLSSCTPLSRKGEQDGGFSGDTQPQAKDGEAEEVIALLKRGFTPIPLCRQGSDGECLHRDFHPDKVCHSPGKHPLVPWKNKPWNPTPEAIRNFASYGVNWAVRTGCDYGFVVVDVDKYKIGVLEASERLAELGVTAETPTALTPSGGEHYYLKSRRQTLEIERNIAGH